MMPNSTDNPKSEIEALVEMLRANPFPEAIEDAREAIESLGAPLADNVVVEKFELAGVPCQILTPPAVDKERLIIYLHGGGFVLGSLVSHEGLAAEIGKAARCCVLQIDYRLAPEHVFPAPIEDCCAVYQALIKRGYDPSKVSLVGDSAGGGLVISTISELKTAGEPLPAAAVCMSPWTDMELSGESFETRKDLDPMIKRDEITSFVEAYMAGQDLRQPTASPIHADLSGFPPLLIQVGEHEVLYSDAERLAENAKQAKVDIVFEAWPEMIHVWHGFYPILKEGRTAIARIGEFIHDKTSH